MIEEHVGRSESTRCPATTEVMMTEYKMLGALPDPVDPVRLDLTCELAIGHEGRHVGLVVAAYAGNQLWWLHWAGQHRDMVQSELCDGRDPDEHDDCLLPYRHRGAHSFEIRPVHEPSDIAAPPQSGADRASAHWPVAPRGYQREAG
ncbi:hypothetical protein [Virgisporangium aurantiacum]|uniref:Uncharacterized protein n=1 Tax=Virgisporangium aurantiacum TaxID=175570 RepID=A0A8J3Z2R2_9ACTN|nr:hypothetical protein [Virgisporangium aurantiacum]GIJ54240.1 hypothetical protein Vau01_017560 [Virgisporangium aurantiacum]